MVKCCQSLAQPPLRRTAPYQLSEFAYLVYSQLPYISGGHALHPHPERCIMPKHFGCIVLQEDELQGAILVVLANKQDIEGSLSVAEVHQALGLDALKNRTFQIFKTSATKGEGLDSAMDWLSNALQNRK